MVWNLMIKAFVAQCPTLGYSIISFHEGVATVDGVELSFILSLKWINLQ